MQTSHSAYYSLLLITILAVLVPVLSSRLRAFRLPMVMGEILAGIVIGRSGFNIVENAARCPLDLALA